MTKGSNEESEASVIGWSIDYTLKPYAFVQCLVKGATLAAGAGVGTEAPLAKPKQSQASHHLHKALDFGWPTRSSKLRYQSRRSEVLLLRLYRMRAQRTHMLRCLIVLRRQNNKGHFPKGDDDLSYD